MIKFYASRSLSITIGIPEKMIAKWKWGGMRQMKKHTGEKAKHGKKTLANQII